MKHGMMIIIIMMMMMMMWMLRMLRRRRRRKIMMLRRMLLRRETDPKTGKHTLCEPAQAKCTWTFAKSHFVWKFKVPGICASLRRRNAHGHFTRAMSW